MAHRWHIFNSFIELHALVCWNGRVTCVRLNEHMNFIASRFCLEPEQFVLRADELLILHQVFAFTNVLQLSKSIERASDRFWGGKECNGEKVWGGWGEPRRTLRFESIMLDLGLRKKLKRHDVKVEEHPHSTILAALPFELLLQELFIFPTINALA